MRQSVLALGLIFCVMANQRVLAQDFWYALPNYDYDYYYGIDLGNGVGYGYGAGIGIPVPLGALTGSKTAEVPEVQGSCCGEAVSPPTSTVDTTIAKLVAVKPKPTAGQKAKKNETKVQKLKQVTETKSSTTPKHLSAMTGKTPSVP